ncbi:MAG: hydrolase [Proteobacteria bacterium]|nr:hydrolase [Pseudomonadota bacterium]
MTKYSTDRTTAVQALSSANSTGSICPLQRRAHEDFMTGFEPYGSRRWFLKVGSLFAWQAMAGCSVQSLPSKGRPLHHTSNGFRNYPSTSQSVSPGFLFFLRRFRGSFAFPEVPRSHYLTEETAIAELNRLKNRNTLTWLGQSTYILRIDGQTILTDPYLSDLASPLPVGPRRYVPPGISMKNLPPIDAIVLSHNHYDHLDDDTIERLPGKEHIHAFVPLGMKPFFTRKGYANVYELDWYQKAYFGGIQMTALPAVHFSNRGIGDRNETLWCSWAMAASSGRYYFAGDTAYSSSLFCDIGGAFRSFDLAIVPIGAYEPIRTMQPVHTNPEEAVQVAMDVKADIMVPSHWGTIELSDEPHWEPPERFADHARRKGVSSERTWIMKIGETRAI